NLVDWLNPGRIEPRRPPFVTTLAFSESSPVSGQHTDQVTIEAGLADDEGTAVEGQTLVLELSTASGVLETATATTNVAGVAHFTLGLDEMPGEYGLRVSFAGSDTLLGSVADQSFTVVKEATATVLSARMKGARTDALVATVTEDDGPAVEGRPVLFYADGQLLGQAVTSSTGVATLAVPAKYGTKKTTYTATFAGDSAYETSSGELAAR
ncbi:MAG: hypothetical protein QOG16_922, partial [Actinomycetota bacterium]|nr:hypothetical protein [Actinomycetota bacterium]